MKKLILFFTLPFFFLFPTIGLSKEVNLLVGEWPPYFTWKRKDNGVLGSIIRKSFEKEKIKVNFYFVKWPEIPAFIKKGKLPSGNISLHGVAFYPKAKPWENYFNFSSPLTRQKIVFFHRKDSPIIWDKFSDLADLKIGTLIGVNYGVPFEKAIELGDLPIPKVFPVSAFGFAFLVHKKIDLFAQEIMVGYHELKEHFNQKESRTITHHSRKSIFENDYFLSIKRSIDPDKKIIKHFNKGLLKLKKEGTFKQLMGEIKDPRKKLYRTNTLKNFLKKWKLKDRTGEILKKSL